VCDYRNSFYLQWDCSEDGPTCHSMFAGRWGLNAGLVKYLYLPVSASGALVPACWKSVVVLEGIHGP
jgi:hypothetical protein